MSLPAIVDALVASGATREMIAAVVRAHCEATPVRTKHAEAQARYREKQKASRVITDDQADHQQAGKECPQTPIETTSLTNVREKYNAGEASIDLVRKAYPKRVGGDPRKTAVKALSKALKDGAAIDEIVAGAKAFARFRKDDDPKFTPMLATWLNRQGWLDDYSAPSRASPSGGRSILSRIAMQDYFDEPVSDHHDDRQAAYTTNTGQRGSAGPVSQRAGADAGGTVVDLRPTRAGWG